MLQHFRESIRAEEVESLNQLQKKGLLRTLLVKSGSELAQPASQKTVDVYSVVVERCFIPPEFNEEHPLYILDVGETLLILFGPRLYDPHTLLVPAQVFDTWIPDKNFFADFSMRCYGEGGVVFEAKIEGDCFVRAEQLDFRFKISAFARIRTYCWKE